MDVYDGTRMYLQIVEMDLGKATELESSLLGIRIEPLDAIIVKQEAG
jgi:hypothetical protein